VSKLNPEEIKRYSRHLVLKEFGAEGQLKLKQARILVVGAGGLGCPALLYLAAAGVGTLGIVDFDVVQESNLQRQVLFRMDDIGTNKANAATNHLRELNPLISITPYPVRLTSQNALDIIGNYDLVIDGSDNFPTRYLVNDACVLLDKSFVYGSVLEYEGQVSVFNVHLNSQYSSNYRDLFHSPPLPDKVPNCEQAGVLGVLPGIIGSIQANEAIKVLTGIGEPLIDRLLLMDSLTLETTQIKIQNKQARLEIKNLVDYEDFCGITEKKIKSLGMKEITVQELQDLQQSGTDFQLIDVREPHEYDICHIEGELIPLAEVPHNIDKISRVQRKLSSTAEVVAEADKSYSGLKKITNWITSTISKEEFWRGQEK
jgi:molybdopterin/thiamine biosynthesis adenylyltransferase/rhodanese-related sulfurtransferase